ncbi:hypothetical protein QGM71_17125 [Virgibacillus sp. C22-A2]|uniref:Peptidase S9A N-terminal domain-containing protein n=1 Tax=Virgibacillus tibetensis TaxID=3042313 RepID=A0ABU6KJ91_9BACI|nr:hypothetical protein [Virgibacillus sp. C22-A2]
MRKSKETVIDNYHGVKVADPYRWLEDSESIDTKKWTDEQINILPT